MNRFSAIDNSCGLTTTMQARAVHRCQRLRAFTLIELMVVIAIIAALATITALGYRGIAKDAKLASGKNTVIAVLDNARSLAMKNNQIVLVVFRPRLDGKHQYVEAVLAQFVSSGVACLPGTPEDRCGGVQGRVASVVDRYVPVAGFPTRTLPRGVMIAGPSYGSSCIPTATDIRFSDETWHVMSHLPAIHQTNGLGERPGEQVAVMFAPDGSTLVQNPATDSNRMFVDYDANGMQDMNNSSGGTLLQFNYSTYPLVASTQYSGDCPNHHGLYEQVFENDEPFINAVPFLAIFDDEKVRELHDVSQWNYQATGAFMKRREDYTRYINNYADRIHFNRYTGVAMK